MMFFEFPGAIPILREIDRRVTIVLSPSDKESIASGCSRNDRDAFRHCDQLFRIIIR
jgi:hypothetical protein